MPCRWKPLMRLLILSQMVGSLTKHYRHGFGDAVDFINRVALLVSEISCRMYYRFFMQHHNLHVNKFYFVRRANLKKEIYSIGGIRQSAGESALTFQMIFSGYLL